MWGNIAAITFFLGLLAPPLWIITVFCVLMEWKHDRKLAIRAAAMANPPSDPGVCPSCGHIQWSVVRKQVYPAMGIRSFHFPMEGYAIVCIFRCGNCGFQGRYGMASERPENGWIMLTNYNLGY